MNLLIYIFFIGMIILENSDDCNAENVAGVFQCKCAQYWPDQGCWTYGNIRVSVEDMTVLVDYTVRKFCIQQVLDLNGLIHTSSNLVKRLRSYVMICRNLLTKHLASAMIKVLLQVLYFYLLE